MTYLLNNTSRIGFMTKYVTALRTAFKIVLSFAAAATETELTLLSFIYFFFLPEFDLNKTITKSHYICT